MNNNNKLFIMQLRSGKNLSQQSVQNVRQNKDKSKKVTKCANKKVGMQAKIDKIKKECKKDIQERENKKADYYTKLFESENKFSEEREDAFFVVMYKLNREKQKYLNNRIKKGDESYYRMITNECKFDLQLVYHYKHAPRSLHETTRFKSLTRTIMYSFDKKQKQVKYALEHALNDKKDTRNSVEKDERLEAIHILDMLYYELGNYMNKDSTLLSTM